MAQYRFEKLLAPHANLAWYVELHPPLYLKFLYELALAELRFF